MTNSPVIVIGMPRSGSTLLTRILNQSSDLFIVNDFYYLQHLESINAFNVWSSEINKHLSEYILKQIKARIEREDSPELECGLFFSVEDEKRLEVFVTNELEKEKYTWSELLEQIMSFAASLLNKNIWGYNTPQDYLQLDRLEQNFANAKFIFMMRDPRSVLRSYKNVTSNGYHETNRYHPILQTSAWRTSVRSFLKRENKNNYLLIRYEDLISNLDVEISRISQFLDSTIPLVNINDFGDNSSFKQKQKALELTNTEAWLCEKIACQEMEKLDYYTSGVQPQLKDVWTIVYLTFQALNFYLSKIISSSDVRKRVWRLIKQIMKESNLN